MSIARLTRKFKFLPSDGQAVLLFHLYRVSSQAGFNTPKAQVRLSGIPVLFKKFILTYLRGKIR